MPLTHFVQEFNSRFEIFMQNVRRVEEHKARNGVSYSLGLNSELHAASRPATPRRVSAWLLQLLKASENNAPVLKCSKQRPNQNSACTNCYRGPGLQVLLT